MTSWDSLAHSFASLTSVYVLFSISDSFVTLSGLFGFPLRGGESTFLRHHQPASGPCLVAVFFLPRPCFWPSLLPASQLTSSEAFLLTEGEQTTQRASETSLH